MHLRNIFDPEGLKNIIKEVVKQAPAEKATHAEGNGIDSVDEKRRSTVRWFMDIGFEQHLRAAVDLANYNAGWRYDIVKPEMLQFTEYEPGGHYSWHTDGSVGSQRNKIVAGNRPTKKFKRNQRCTVGDSKKN